MQSFSIRDLRQRSGDLVRDTEQGKLALVTKHGRPILVTVPMNERLIEAGVYQAMAVKLFEDGVLSTSRAARVAGVGIEAFLELLAAAGVAAVDYEPNEIDDEVRVLER